MYADNDGIRIHYQAHGHGEPAVLLHGFPDTGRVWRHQVPALLGAGLRVIVPDLRGYGRSGQPDQVSSYAMSFLVADVVAVLDHLGIGRAHVVGHDWGAGIAWALAALHPDRVDHLAVLSVGHPAAFASAGLAQREKSWYMLLFQFPGIAERWLSQDDWANFRAWAGHPDADAVAAELEASGSLTPGLNWYRANLAPETLLAPPRRLPPVAAPALGIWSSNDIALTETQMTASAGYARPLALRTPRGHRPLAAARSTSRCQPAAHRLPRPHAGLADPGSHRRVPHRTASVFSRRRADRAPKPCDNT